MGPAVERSGGSAANTIAFARLPQYHTAFTSCNRVFQLEKAKRTETWCCDCDKCRFVFLILAPFLGPEKMRSIFGTDMLNDEQQYPGFALLTGTGGDKPFECVGELEESLAAVRLLAADARWCNSRVVERLIHEVLPRFGPGDGLPDDTLALGDENAVPSNLVNAVHALLGA